MAADRQQAPREPKPVSKFKTFLGGATDGGKVTRHYFPLGCILFLRENINFSRNLLAQAATAACFCWPQISGSPKTVGGPIRRGREKQQGVSVRKIIHHVTIFLSLDIYLPRFADVTTWIGMQPENARKNEKKSINTAGS